MGCSIEILLGGRAVGKTTLPKSLDFVSCDSILTSASGSCDLERTFNEMNYVAVDSGTTNSRVWLMRGRKIVAKKQVAAGVRNTAIDGHNRALMQGIRHAILDLRNSISPEDRPETVIAAGMITSALGLHEVKHAQAPAGIEDLAAGIQTRSFDETDDVLFHFIPGVRSGPAVADLQNVNSIDIMRGEETEIFGAIEEFELRGPLLYIHLGSHTKLIQIDALQRIVGGASTLAGELLLSIQQQTILRSSLPESQVVALDEEFFQQGWKNCQTFGLTRALYQVRIFDLNSRFTKESLFSFLLGSLLYEEFRCLDSLTPGAGAELVILSGLPHLQPAWAHALKRSGFRVRCLTAEETERAFLVGLLRIFSRSERLSP
jgi:2-dehydro-3-deoxygalactonokinase